MKLIVFMLHLCLIASIYGKKKSKLHLQLQNQVLASYKDVMLLHYGSDDGRIRQRFVDFAEHHKHDAKLLDECKESLKGRSCVEQVKTHLEKVKHSTIVLILNHDYALINVDTKALLQILSSSEGKSDLTFSHDYMNYGLNIVADHVSLLENVKKVLKRTKPNLMMLENASVDTKSNFFVTLKENEKLTDFAKQPGKLKNIKFNLKPDGVLVFLLKKNPTIDIFDHLANMLFSKPLKKPDLQDMEPLFVCLTIPEQTLFLDDFFQAFLGQDYPKEAMILSVSVSKDESRKVVDSYLKEAKFQNYILNDIGTVAAGRMQCIKEFKESPADKILFISPRSILDDPTTLSYLVTQDVPFVAPKLFTYSYPARNHYNCDFGWNRSISSYAQFPSEDIFQDAGGYRINRRDKFGMNFVDITRANVATDVQFWNLDAAENNQENGSVNYEKDEKQCCIIRVDRVRYLYLIKKAVLDVLDLDKMSSLSNEDQFDDLLCDKVKKNHSIFLMNENIYGQIVNMENFPMDKKKAELYRIFENHALWEKKYIKPSIRSHIKHSKDHSYEKGNYIKRSKCFDTLEVDLFNDVFIDHFKEEFQFEGIHKPLHEFDFEDEWISIINFYTEHQTCGFWQGESSAITHGRFAINQVSSKQVSVNNLIDPDSRVNIFLGLSQPSEDYAGGGLNFYRYNCSSTLPKGTLLLSPGDLTHSYSINTVTKGTFTFLESRLDHGRGIKCFMYHGLYKCPGFKTFDESQSRNE